MRAVHTILLAFGFGVGSNAYAEVTTDDRLWLSAAVRGDLAKDVRAQFTQELRLPLAGEYNQQIMPALELKYTGVPHVSVGTGGRYTFETLEDKETMRAFRMHGDLGLSSPEIGPIEFGYRLRYQHESSASIDPSKNRIRNRFDAQISTGSIVRPGAFFEHYLDPKGENGNKAKKYRLGADLGIKIHQDHRLKIKLFQDTELDGDGDKVRVVALGYRYSV